MFTRTVAGLAGGLACLLLSASSAPAQGGKGSGDAIKKLETDLEKLRNQIKQTEADLAKAKQQSGGRGWSGRMRGGFDGYRGRDGYKWDGGKLDPAMIKDRYEHYKKLYDALPKEKNAPAGKGRGFDGRPGGFGSGRFGPSAGSPPASVEARIERLMREFEDLRKELKKKGP